MRVWLWVGGELWTCHVPDKVAWKEEVKRVRSAAWIHHHRHHGRSGKGKARHERRNMNECICCGYDCVAVCEATD